MSKHAYIERLYLVLIAVCIQYNLGKVQAEPIYPNLDFDQVKNDLFLRNSINLADSGLSFDDEVQRAKCLESLNDIGNAVRGSEMWAIKMLDAWGKFPSGILSGNLYELGEFSECLKIERDGSKVETQYCMGTFAFDLKPSFLKQKSLQLGEINWNIGKFGPTEKDPLEPTPRMGGLMQPKSALGITIGICVPESCPPHILDPIINEHLIKNDNISVQFTAGNCQTEETPSSLKTLDIIMICLLSVFVFLITASTSYDVFFTLLNRDKARALLAFSFYTNGMKLLSYEKSKSPDMMHCLHGIRVISTMWVAMGHTFIFSAALPIRNTLDILQFPKKYQNMIIMSAPISVDTFFVMSGLLASLNILKQLEKTNGKMNIPLLYFHRYLRLTPILAMSVAFSMSLFRFIGSGPFWPTFSRLDTTCETYWWSLLLYVQNYVNPTKICYSFSWYLSVDMQLFLISPFVVYLVYWFRIKVVPVLILFVLGCVGCTIAAYMQNDITGILGSVDKTYFPTHIRYSPWLIGVIAGYVLFETRKTSIRIPQIFNLIAWVISLGVMTAVIFANYPLAQFDNKNTALEFGLYAALSRIGWAIALSYIIFACVHNYGGPVNVFLSNPLWQPLSRLSYSIYLLHYFVLITVMGTVKAPTYFTEFMTVYKFIGIYVLTVFLAIIATLAFESPIVVIEKFIFGARQTGQARARQPSAPNVEPNDSNFRNAQ